MTKKKSVYPFIVLSLILIFNPCVNLIDIFPDVIAYLILILAIGKLARTVPHLAECKAALVKLAMISAVKIPAFAIMYANLASGSDIIPLFTLSFNVIEIILLYSAIRNIFATLSYAAERAGCRSVDNPYLVGTNLYVPEEFQVLTYAFFAVKATLNFIPEILLLTVKNVALKKAMSDAYPYVLTVCVIASLVVGIIWLKHAIGYLKYIRQIGDLGEALTAIDGYVSVSAPQRTRTEEKLHKLLTLLAISSIFTFDIIFQDLGGYNILPHFIYGIIIFCAFYGMSKNVWKKLILSVLTLGFAIVSIFNHSRLVRFFDTYQYHDLSYSTSAKAEYAIIKATSLIETVCMLFILGIATLCLIEFINENTEISPSDPEYSTSNKRAHLRLIKTTLPMIIFPAVITVMKCINVFLKESVKILYSEANPNGIVTSIAPAMDTVIFFISIVFVIYAFAITASLKEEIKFKYGK